MSCLKLNKNKISKLFSAMPDIEMNPLLFKAFSLPTTSHEETSFQRIQPYASLHKSGSAQIGNGSSEAAIRRNWFVEGRV
jgi:hypothetical protein